MGLPGHATARALHSAETASTHRRWDRDRFCSHCSSSSPEDSSDGFSKSWLSSLLSTTSLTSGLPVGHCAWFRCQPARSSSWKEALLSSFWGRELEREETCCLRAGIRKSSSQLGITATHKEKQRNGVEPIFRRTGVLLDPAACPPAFCCSDAEQIWNLPVTSK